MRHIDFGGEKIHHLSKNLLGRYVELSTITAVHEKCWTPIIIIVLVIVSEFVLGLIRSKFIHHIKTVEHCMWLAVFFSFVIIYK